MMYRIAKVICACGSVYTKFIDMENDVEISYCNYCGGNDKYEIIIDGGEYWLKKEVLKE